jgi:hypothetical protein
MQVSLLSIHSRSCSCSCSLLRLLYNALISRMTTLSVCPTVYGIINKETDVILEDTFLDRKDEKRQVNYFSFTYVISMS